MQILLIDNNTLHKQALTESLYGHEVEIIKYEPGTRLNYQNKDLIVLSGGGGKGREANDLAQDGKLWYQDQMDFVMICNKPIVGICMGFEVICSAYGDKVVELGETIKGFKQINTTSVGKQRIGKDKIKQYEAHKFGVQGLSSNEFEVLAESSTGIEVIKHKNRPIFATQFHPEVKGGSLKLQNLVLSVSK